MFKGFRGVHQQCALGLLVGLEFSVRKDELDRNEILPFHRRQGKRCFRRIIAVSRATPGRDEPDVLLFGLVEVYIRVFAVLPVEERLADHEQRFDRFGTLGILTDKIPVHRDRFAEKIGLRIILGGPKEHCLDVFFAGKHPRIALVRFGHFIHVPQFFVAQSEIEKRVFRFVGLRITRNQKFVRFRGLVVFIGFLKIQRGVKQRVRGELGPRVILDNTIVTVAGVHPLLRFFEAFGGLEQHDVAILAAGIPCFDGQEYL